MHTIKHKPQVISQKLIEFNSGSICRAYMGGQYCPNTVLIEDLVVIITGADGGIGEEIVKELTKRSAQIVMACKMVENGEKVKKQILKQHPTARIVVQNLDLRSFDNVRRFVKGIGK